MTQEQEQELERLKDELEDLERYVEEFSSFLPIAVCTVNPKGVIINANAAFERMTDYGPIESIGKQISSFFEEQQTLESLLEQLQEGETFSKSTETTIIKKDDTPCEVSVTASTRTDKGDNFLGFFVSMSDITELKKLQNNLEEQVRVRTEKLNERTKELEESNKKLEHAYRAVKREREKTLSVVSNLTDGLVFVNSEGYIELLNPHAEDILQLDAQALIGERLISEEGENIEPLARMAQNITQPVDREQVTLPEGQHLEVSIVPVVANETNLGTLIVLHDISREKALEKLKLEFVSVAAHQMRTPLSAVKWSFELLLASDEEDLSPKLKKIAANGFESTQRVLRIVNNFLNVGAIESSTVEYSFSPVDLQKVVQNIFSEVMFEAEKKNIQLTFAKQDTPLPPLRADQEKLNLVLQNLIENALKYTMEKGTVMVDAVQRGEKMLISVQDSGIGIPESEQENIFTKFYRADNARRLQTDGNGLGLYMTKQIVEEHGGSIWFESSKDKGTTFFFTIPLYTQKEQHGTESQDTSS